VKRDAELIRKMLIAIEECPADERINSFNFEGYDHDTVVRHLELLIDAGLVDGEVIHYVSSDPSNFVVHDLTWEGHDFVDAVRDETIWKKVKEKLLKPTGSWTFGLIVEYAKAEIRSRLGF